MSAGLRLLCLCDSPTKQSGFSRVAQNLLRRWAPAFTDAEGKVRIDVWGVGYQGYPHELPYRIFPAGTQVDSQWCSPGNLQRFLTLLECGEYTHLWMMQDLWNLQPLAHHIRRICKAQKIRSLLYFPVDAPLEPEWGEMVKSIDVPVAYCEYGKDEALRVMKGGARDFVAKKMRVIPHGTDTSIYKPIGKALARSRFQGPKGPLFSEDDFVMVNVNANQRRKGIVQSLEILAEMPEFLGGGGMAVAPEPRRRVFLYLHMPRRNAEEGVDLAMVARQLGVLDRVLFAPDQLWPHGVAEVNMPMVYCMADLLLTTTCGEGWGLSITEAMACGVPVAGPRHTSVKDILADGRGILLQSGGVDVMPGDNSRARPRVDAEWAAAVLSEILEDGKLRGSVGPALEWVGRLDWDTIAGRWLELMEIDGVEANREIGVPGEGK